MREKELSIESIDDINDFYKILDENSIWYERYRDIVELILNYKNRTLSDEEKQKLQWEVEVFLFSFRGADIFAFSSSNGKEVGEVSQYPQLDEYQRTAFDYIKDRATDSACSLLRARYNHILWRGIIGKNKQYAQKAANDYTETINFLLSAEVSDNYHLVISRLYENLVGIINEIKVDVEKLKDLTKQLLFDTADLPFWSKHGIVEDMLTYPKVFKSADFTGVLQIFYDRIKESDGNSDDFLLVNSHLPTAIKVASKLKSDVKFWYNEIGMANVRIASRETEVDRNWLKLEAYRAAIEAFRFSGNSEKKAEVEQLYFELKPDVILESFRIDYDEETIQKLRDLQNELNNKAKLLLRNPPEYVYATIANGLFFPAYDDVLNASKKNNDAFLEGISTIYFDNNKNISRQSGADEEKRKLLETYGRRINETLVPFLHYVFVQGIESGHLTHRNLLQFLAQHTWIGKPYEKTDLSGDPEVSNWVYQVTPSIVEFFNQILAWGKSKYYTPSFILCIDSLTLKIEGLFRNFSERLNISTSKGKKKGMQEALADDIINNEAIKQYFDRNDILLFDYVFSNNGGLNLRNNIAHCFYSENEYHPDKMLLLLAVLLRIGKYNVSEQPT